MMKMGKWMALGLTAALLVGVTGTALAAPTVPGAVYSDSQASGTNKPVAQVAQDLRTAGIQDVKPTDWAAGSITVVVQAGLLKPDANGQFHPEATLNTGDAVAVFAKVLGVAAKNDTPEVALQKAKDAGLVGPAASPDHDMTRIEVARLLATALGVQPKIIRIPADYPFNDARAVTSPEDQGILAALYDLGIFKGYQDRTFRPDAILTRAQIALLIDRILGATAR
ncbi:MAG TPA: S-layer homology domain-containing protein [Symbiobacteriaceae bacterium]|jgi:hypothetical protein